MFHVWPLISIFTVFIILPAEMTRPMTLDGVLKGAAMAAIESGGKLGYYGSFCGGRKRLPRRWTVPVDAVMELDNRR